MKRRVKIGSCVVFFVVLLTVCYLQRNGDSCPGETHIIRPNFTFRPPIGGSLNCSDDALMPSAQYPDDVNKVRPADIMYIAALGDSITAGSYSYDSAEEYIRSSQGSCLRWVGNSFDMGGNGQLDTHVTLPNILKHLNPKLKGYSVGSGMEEEKTGLNVAVAGRWSKDIPRQARELVERMKKNYSAASLARDWKLIHIFVGTNDALHICREGGGSSKEEYKSAVRESLFILQEALPRTIISLIGIWNANFSIRARVTIDKMKDRCDANFEQRLRIRSELYRDALEELSWEFRFTTKDKTVLMQHLFTDIEEPLKNPDGSYNIDFYAPDTFHLSNYGNSLVAKQLWRQLLLPVGSKRTSASDMADESPSLACPDPACPFIRTTANSVRCSSD